MSYNMNYLSHLRAVQACLPALKIRANMDFARNSIELLARGKYVVMHPQYAALNGVNLAYTDSLSSAATHFIGWRNYINKRWRLSTDKLMFKRYCEGHGLRTPSMVRNLSDTTTGAILKRADSSFGEGIDGPLLPGSEFRELARGEYFETFVRGDICKMWFWDEQPVAMEVKPMVTVTGNGRATLRDLVNEIKSSFLPVHWDEVAKAAAFDGFSGLDDVVPDEQKVLVDFRYLSALHASRLDNLNVKPRYDGTKAMAQFEAAGKLFWKGIPPAMRQHTLYSVDAIIDANEDVWFLEMNSNPIVQPDAYPFMLEGLFGKAA